MQNLKTERQVKISLIHDSKIDWLIIAAKDGTSRSIIINRADTTDITKWLNLKVTAINKPK